MRRKRGFTLVELMVVIVIVGILATLAWMNYPGRIDGTKWQAAQAEMAELHKALSMWSVDHENQWPESLETLGDMLPGKRVPRDPFTKEPYAYEKTTQGFRLVCLGKDGIEGGSRDIDRDIVFDESGQTSP